MKTKPKPLKPCDAKTLAQICKLPRDNIDTPSHWCSISESGYVTIVAQKMGESATEEIRLPRRTFEKFARWYLTGKV